MRRVVVGLIGLLALYAAGWSRAADGPDIWSGSYRMEWVKGAREPGQDGQLIVLTRTSDANPADLVEKYQVDLARWILTDPADSEQGVRLRRFIAEEYEGWGWTGMHAADRIRCLDASRLFICKTTPGTTVFFGPEGSRQERLLARTGLFGIALHAGAFELKKE